MLGQALLPGEHISFYFCDTCPEPAAMALTLPSAVPASSKSSWKRRSLLVPREPLQISQAVWGLGGQGHHPLAKHMTLLQSKLTHQP